MRMNINPKVKISDILFMVCMVLVLSLPGSSPLKAISIIVFFCYMMAMKLLNYKTINNTLHIVGAFLFLCYAYISRKWALYPAAVSEQINNVLWTVLLSTAISTYVVHRDLCVEDIVKRLIPVALLLFVNVLLNASFDRNRLSVGINENSFGRLSGGIACFMLYRCRQDKWKNVFLDVVTGILVLFTFLSGSRTSVLILGIYVIAVFAFELPTKNSVKMAKNLLAVVLLCVAGYICVTKISFLYNTIGHRIEDLLKLMVGTSEGDESSITRMKMMNRAREIFWENPWIGIGLNNFKYATYHNTYAHNNYYELAACLGIVGLALYYMPPVVYLVRAASKWKRNEAEMIVPLAILGAFILGDIGSVSYLNTMSHVFVGLAIGLLAKHRTQCQEPSLDERG